MVNESTPCYHESMHEKQKILLKLINEDKDIGSYSLRTIAEKMGSVNKPQLAKYHLQKLSEAGLITLNFKENIIKPVKKGYIRSTINSVFSLPIVGSANCGPANIFAEQNIQQYLKVSSSLLPYSKKDLYGLIADGESMNVAKVGSKKEPIKNRDFVLVDSSIKNYKDGDVVVAVIDSMATIKQYENDKVNNRIVLRAQSDKEDYLPIFIHEGDDFEISGKVVGVIKG
jgi:repressor LexA